MEVNTMIKVQVVRKLYDNNQQLIGYTIRDAQGVMRNVWKDALKNAVRSNQVEVVNMTLTSDGRFIGAAQKKDIINSAPNTPAVSQNIVGAFNRGKFIIAYMVDNNGEKVIMHNACTDVQFAEDIKKKQFKTLRDKLIDSLKKEGINTKFEVAKIGNGLYSIDIPITDKKVQNIVIALLYDGAVELKLPVENVVYSKDGASLVVKSSTGIGETRKLAKSIK